MGFWRFVEAGSELGAPLHGDYSAPLVALSFVVASLAGYAGLEFADRLRRHAVGSDLRRRAAWLVAGSVAMGSGVWSMHFVAMLAFRLPASVHYDLAVTLASGVPAALACCVALLILRRASVDVRHLTGGGLVMAVGIGTMHYVGMEAMHVAGGAMFYEPIRFGLSIVVAAVLSIATLYIKFVLGARAGLPRLTIRVASAGVFGAAVCGMHYTAMTAARFYLARGATATAPATHGSVRLALIIAASTTLIMGLAFVATAVGRRLDRAAEDVRALEARTRLVLGAVGEGIIGIDEEAKITFINPAGAEMLGYEPADLIGESMHAALHETEQPADSCGLCGISEALKRGRDQSLRRRDRSSFPVSYTRTPIVIEGAIVGAVVVFGDISQQLATERALVSARDAADAGARAKSEFLANMSHEIRTPMNGVIGVAQILAASELTEDQRECVDALLVSGESLMTIINDILDFSKIEAGKLRIAPHAFELKRLLGDVVRVLMPAGQDKGLELDLEIGAAVPERVVGDSHRVRQILLNLLGNAVKFTHEGRVRLQVDRVGGNADDVKLKFAVIDTGIGIDEETQGRLFQPFSQADSSTTRRFGGTGLGLAICRQLAVLMGGEIRLRSARGQGSTFWFQLSLPVAEAEETDRSPSGVRPSVIPGGGARFSRRVLVVEDNRINQMVARRLLTGLGCDVQLAGNGVEALDLLRATDYDLVFMDCYMPEMDGFEATRRLRECERNQTCPVIAMTASVLPADRDRCIAVGMDDYVAKPIDQHELAGVLAKWGDHEARDAA